MSCSVGGGFGIHLRDRDYAEVCLDTTTTEEEDAPEEVIVTCECNGTTEFCTNGTTTENALACVPEEVEVTCACDGTTEVCSDGSSTENANSCQPQEPDPVFTSAVLTGEVYTLCDTANRPVNLKLVAGTDNALVTQELANGNLQILIGGTDISSTCQVSPLNTAILTCTYPADLTSLPAEGQVLYKTTLLQTFRFDGETGCTAPPSGGTNTEPETCDPNEPGTPCFCVENPNDESCATPD